jgi:PAS domain S-box-containing protein
VSGVVTKPTLGTPGIPSHQVAWSGLEKEREQMSQGVDTTIDGTSQCWMQDNLEIEGHKQAEFYLKEAQRLAHTGSWTFGAAGFGHWSSQLFQIHGLKPGKAPSIAEYINLVHPEDRAGVAKAIDGMLSDRRQFDFTKRIVRPDGVVRHVRCVGVPLTDGDTFRGFIGTGIDVTEQERLSRELRRSEDELRQILDLTPQLIAVFGPHRERLYLNRTSLDYFGFDLAEWRAAPPGPDIHPEDSDRLRDRWANAASSAFEVEVRFRRNDGIYRWFLIRCNPMCDDRGAVLRWYAACTDIENRKRNEERLQQENTALRAEMSNSSIEEIVGSSEPLRTALSEVGKVAPTDSTVLILGETGTGKELIARAIHRRSKRAGGAFVGVNCAAIPASLMASELFGHEKGAFTGATQRRLGRFEAANGGTIFLDEIGDLSPDIQISLLRVLQEREIQRVGSEQPIPVDVRVLAATHRDLEKLMSEGKFREDLFYRLNVVPLTMPPLRDRAADIPVLVRHFIDQVGRRSGKKFDAIEKRTMDILRAYSWPGNVRELQNVIERAVTLSDAETFTVDQAWLNRRRSAHQAVVALGDKLVAHEKEAIEAALAACRGRLSGPAGAAAKLGVPTSTLNSKIKRLGIDTYRFKSQSAS